MSIGNLRGRVCLLCLALQWGALVACDGEGGKKAVHSCGDDQACVSGVCFEGACYEACTSTDDCAPNEFCVSEAGSSRFCAPAARYAGCANDAACSALVARACQEPVCDTEKGLCGLQASAEGSACESGGATGTCRDGVCAGAGWTREVMDVGALLKGIEVEGGVELRRSLKVPLLGDFSTLRGVRVDVEATLAHVRFTPADPEATGPVEIQAWVRLGVGDEEDRVCENGEPFEATVSTDEAFAPTTAEPASVELSACTLRLLDAHTFSVCYGVTASVSGSVDVDQVEADILEGEPCEEAPGDFGGIWSGTYACLDSCAGQGEPQAITLQIVQEGEIAFYGDDGDGRYQGRICGDRFSYAGGGEGYRECGELVLSAPGVGTKESDYEDLFGPCTGHCIDQLTRMEGFD